MSKNKVLYHDKLHPKGCSFPIDQANSIMAMKNNGGWYELDNKLGNESNRSKGGQKDTKESESSTLTD